MLPLSLIPNGVQTCSYVGPLEAVGVAFLQAFDLTAFPEYVRAARGFTDQLFIVLVATPGISNPAPPAGVAPVFTLDVQGVPISMELTFTSTDITAQIAMLVHSAHTAVR
jgi:hypothetical protein